MTASPRVPRLAGGALAGWEPAHRKRHTRNVYMNTSDVMKLLRPASSQAPSRQRPSSQRASSKATSGGFHRSLSPFVHLTTFPSYSNQLVLDGSPRTLAHTLPRVASARATHLVRRCRLPHKPLLLFDARVSHDARSLLSCVG